MFEATIVDRSHSKKQKQDDTQEDVMLDVNCAWSEEGEDTYAKILKSLDEGVIFDAQSLMALEYN